MRPTSGERTSDWAVHAFPEHNREAGRVEGELRGMKFEGSVGFGVGAVGRSGVVGVWVEVFTRALGGALLF